MSLSCYTLRTLEGACFTIKEMKMNNFIKIGFLSNLKNPITARVIRVNKKDWFEIILLPEPGYHPQDFILFNNETKKQFSINEDGVAIVPFSSKIDPNKDRLVISQTIEQFISQ